MASVHETAYPRFKPNLTKSELKKIYTPSSKDIEFVQSQRRHRAGQLSLMLLVKTVQRLGYFVKLSQIPDPIKAHIEECLGFESIAKKHLKKFDTAATRNRLVVAVRKHLEIKPLPRTSGVDSLLSSLAMTAAETKHQLVDIINVVLEELAAKGYEFPGFTILLRHARAARNQVNEYYFGMLSGRIDNYTKQQLNEFLQADGGGSKWQDLKQEPKKPTNKEVKRYLKHLKWLQSWKESLPDITKIPGQKRRQYILEARSMNITELRKSKATKRYALIIVLINAQLSQSLDDVVGIFKRKLNALNNNAETKLKEYHLAQTKRTERLIGQLRDVLVAYEDSDTDKKRISQITQSFKDEPAILLAECEEHLAYSGNNYYPFMLAPYQAQRPLLLNCLELLNLKSSSNDHSLLHALKVILEHRSSHKQILPYTLVDFNLQWVNDKWKKLTQGSEKGTLNKKYFELCVLTRIKRELESGDLFIEFSDCYADYREQLVSWETYDEEIDSFAEMLSLPSKPKEFVGQLKQSMLDISERIDKQYKNNEYLDFDNGQLVIKKHNTKGKPALLGKLDEAIKEQLEQKSILDILIESEKWLDIHKSFGPISGLESKLDDPRKRFITTLFCYGCNLGPSQTARSIKELSRKQVAWLNLKYITEEKLEKASFQVINAYNKFELPSYWGTGKSASADGTKWNLYEQNLLSEYHIRYGGYGGIGYYHVSDTYIALFSHFIPCGVYEAIYILDGLVKNESDIQPDTMHGDTQSQSTTVFGLAHLLGIELMPRIRSIKKLIFHKADKKVQYEHISQLFRGTINWDLIERHVPDMLRVALSIKSGKLSPSTILKRLGTYSRKNKLYFAFRELGRAIRTIFLLKYIGDVELRRTIHAATNKSEEFNNFTKWLFFGGEGVIAENVRFEQRKVIKYNQLVANLVILHNVESMSLALKNLKNSEIPLSEELLKGLSPYRTEHINRFGDYRLDLSKKIKPMSFKMNIID